MAGGGALAKEFGGISEWRECYAMKHNLGTMHLTHNTNFTLSETSVSSPSKRTLTSQVITQCPINCQLLDSSAMLIFPQPISAYLIQFYSRCSFL